MIKRKKLGKSIEDIAHYYLSSVGNPHEETPAGGGSGSFAEQDESVIDRDEQVTRTVCCIAPYRGTGFSIGLLAECLTYLGSNVTYRYLSWGGKQGGVLHTQRPVNPTVSPFLNFDFLVLESGISRGVYRFILEVDSYLCLVNLHNSLSAIRSLGYLKQVGSIDPDKWLGIITEGDPLPRNGISSINRLCRTLKQVLNISPRYLGGIPPCTGGPRNRPVRGFEPLSRRKAYFRIAAGLYSGLMNKTGCYRTIDIPLEHTSL